MQAGKDFGLSKRRQRSGVIVKTNLTDRGKLTVKIGNYSYLLGGKPSFIVLPPYAQYKLEILNDENYGDSFNTVSGREQESILYPGNVGVINPEVKNMVTVFGHIRYSDGQLIANIDIHNHISRTCTNEEGKFAIDIDKKYPAITLISANNRICEANLDLEKARGVAQVDDTKRVTQTTMVQR